MKSPILNISSIIISIAILLVVSSCQTNEDMDVTVKKYKNTFRGSAFLYSPSASNNDIKVTLQKGNFTKQTQTSEQGLFFFDSLETGTYDLLFEKEGFGTHKTFGVRHFGYPSDTLPKTYVLLYKIATSVVQKTGIVYHDKYEDNIFHFNFLNIELDIANMTVHEESVIVFVSRDKNVSKDLHEFFLTKEYSNFWISNTPENNYKGITIPYRDLLKKGYKNGDKLYFKFYTVNRKDVGYNDYELKKQVFPTISSNQVPILEYTLSF